MNEEKTLEQTTLDDIDEMIKVFENKTEALIEVDRKHLSEHDLDIELSKLEHKLLVGVCAVMQHYRLNK